MTNTTMSEVKPTFNSFMDYTKLDRNRQRTVVFYGRVSTEHEAQLSALENQMQQYSDQAKYHPNWNVIDKYIDEGITGTLRRHGQGAYPGLYRRTCGKCYSRKQQ